MAALWIEDVRSGRAPVAPSEASLAEMRDVIVQFGGYFVVDARDWKVERTWVPVVPEGHARGLRPRRRTRALCACLSPSGRCSRRWPSGNARQSNALLGEAVARLVHPPTTAIEKR
jgi:hypothetical protein